MKCPRVFVTVIGTVFLGAALLASPNIASAQQAYSASDNWEVSPGDYIHEGGIPGCGQVSFDPVAAAAQAIAGYEVGGVYGRDERVFEFANEIWC